MIDGDGTAIPAPDDTFSSAVCFVMLHHVPAVALQRRFFEEVLRVLKPAGVFAGGDGVDGLVFRLMHPGDTFNPLPPETLAQRLASAGFEQIVTANPDRHRQRWRAIVA